MVPCGSCPICRERQSKEWSIRLTQELKDAVSASFITLTYNDENNPGELEKSHLQKFFKRLRKKNQYKIRYYAVGEYGSENLRPHYHACVFNVEEKNIMTLEQIWQKGFAKADPLTEGRIKYVTDYIQTKNNNVVGWDLTQPFAVMSKGLGLGYLTPEKIQYHRNTGNNFITKPGGIKVSMPRYYREKIWDQEQRSKIRTDNEMEAHKRTVKEFKKLAPTGSGNQYKNPFHKYHEIVQTKIEKIQKKQKSRRGI